MGWNYRVLRFEQPDGDPWYAIHEVHYDKGGVISGWTEGAARVGDESRDGLFNVLAMMIDALDHEVLDGETGAPVEERRVLSDQIRAALQAAADAGLIELAPTTPKISEADNA